MSTNLVENDHWRKCNSCKKPIGYRTKYWVCNVSTCQRKRTGFVFCSVTCWDVHVPVMNHRDSWAEERMSPSRDEWAREQDPEQGPRRVSTSGGGGSVSMESEVLVVVSKLKAYIKAKSDMNTSGDVADELSKVLRNLCDDAMIRARQDGRKTVMARDFSGE